MYMYMYSELRQGGKTDVCLWCNGDGSSEESEYQRKCKRGSSPGPTSKRTEKEREFVYLVTEVKGMHRDKCNLSDPQYRLWAIMHINGIHPSNMEHRSLRKSR